jgi:hypothetical protein
MKHKRNIHLFETNPEYVILYQELLKNENYWRNSGQYFMARECGRRAKCLLNENIDDYKKVTHTEDLYCPTKKMKCV